MKTRTKQLIAAGAVLALILVATRFLPKGLDKAVWTHKSDPKHVTIINYDAGKPPAVGVTLAEERSAEMMEQLSALHGRKDAAKVHGHDFQAVAVCLAEPGGHIHVIAHDAVILHISKGDD